MAINRVKHRGKSRIEVRKRWPDGTTFRRHYPNKRQADMVFTKIEASIHEGTWPELKRRLNGSKNGGMPTVQEFSKRFLSEYAKPRLRSWWRYEIGLRSLLQRFGKLRIDRLQRSSVYNWTKQRSREVSQATVNRELTALKKMCSWALEIGVLEQNQLAGFRLFREEIKERRPLTFEEYLVLIDRAANNLVRSFIIVLGETGCRKEESLHLKRDDLDFATGTVAFNRVKNRKARIVPISPRLEEALRERLSGPRSSPYLLENPHTGKRLKDPKRGFATAARLAGLPWLCMHDMRRFRATQWAVQGIPIQTIRKLLGHADLQTTMRYLLHLDSSFEAVREAFKRESGGRHLGDREEGSRKGVRLSC